MKTMAMVSAGFLPIPAVKGGAVEVLGNHIIDGNEVAPQYMIDVYTVPDTKLEKMHYQYTNIIQVKSKCYAFHKVVNKCRNIFYKITGKKRLYGVYDYLISQAVCKKSYDYIVVENNMNMFELLAQGKAGKEDKLILHLHNNVNVGDIAKSEELTRIAGDAAFCVLAVSDFIKERFQQICPATRTDTLYNCVDKKQFSPKSLQVRKEYRDKYHIEEDEVLVMFSGRAAWEKGLKELVEAFLMLKEIPNLKLMIVGNSWFGKEEKDDYLEEVITLAKECKEQIFFTGFVHPDEMPAMYEMADMVVVPSIWNEPFGVVVLEAMAMKKPIITTYSGGIPEIVNENCAILLSREDKLQDNLARAIRELYEQPQKRNGLAGKAYERLQAHPEFDKENYFLNFVDLIEKH